MIESAGKDKKKGGWVTALISAVLHILIIGAVVAAGYYVKKNPEVIEKAIPAFITLITIPLTYSIAHGIGYGFVSFVLIKLLSGKPRGARPLMYAVAAAFVIYFVTER